MLSDCSDSGDSDTENNDPTLRPFLMMALNKKAPKRKPKPFRTEEIVEQLVEYNRSLAGRTNCFSRLGSNRSLNCSCPSILGRPALLGTIDNKDLLLEAVVGYQVYFCGLSRKEQYIKVIEWMRYAGVVIPDHSRKSQHCKFRIPFSVGNQMTSPEEKILLQDLGKHPVCLSSIMSILNIGRKFYATVKGYHLNNSLPIDPVMMGNRFVHNYSFQDGQEEDLHIFFGNLKLVAEPSATRFTRELTMRDKDDDAIYLPSSLSRRDCYRQYCKDRGKLVVTKYHGATELVDIESFDGPRKTCIHWSTFYRFWRKEYP